MNRPPPSTPPPSTPPFTAPGSPPAPWPKPPFACEPPSLSAATAEPCRVELSDGSAVVGSMAAMDKAVGIVSLRIEGASRLVPFSRLRRLTLTAPLRPVGRGSGAAGPGSAPGAEDREYRLRSTEPGKGPIVGRTLGYVQAPEGFYLFPPDGRGGVLRAFVPRLAYSDYQFGPFADPAGRQEISDPDELLLALERQRTLRVLPIGHSLVALGLITPGELEQALAKQTPNEPLGEFLVRTRQVSALGLEQAIAHKMGFPVVDLVHFPIDKLALERLTLRSAIAMRAVPVLTDGQRLIVAVSKVSRANKLRALPMLSKQALVPVLAPKNRIIETLTRMSEHQSWQGVPVPMRFFQTTA